MITNYIKPQLLIRQLLEVLPSVTEPSLNAFVYGPQFKLNRYTESEERAKMSGTAFVAKGEEEPRLIIPYEGVSDGSQVDLDFVSLHVEDMELSLASFDSAVGPTEVSPNAFFFNKASRPNEIICRSTGGNPDIDNEVNLYDASAGELADELDGRPVAVGDLVVVTENILAGAEDKVHRRRIMDVKQSTEKSFFDDPACGPKNIDSTSAGTNVVGEAIHGISSTSKIAIAVDDNAVSTEAAFLEVGSGFGGGLTERFNVRFTSPSSDGDDGEARIRTVSNNFEADGVVVTHSGTTASFVIPNCGVKVTISDVANILGSDSFDFTVSCAYTALDCGASAGGNDIEVIGSYLHKEDTNIVALCTKGDVNGAASTWVLSDSAGVDDVLTVTGSALAAGVTFGASGLTIKCSKAKHAATDEFSVACTAAGETGAYSVLVLDAPAGDLTQVDEDNLPNLAISTVEIRAAYAGSIARRGLNAPREQWTATPDGIQVEADLAHKVWGFGDNQDEARFVKFTSANASNWQGPFLFASYRELVPAQPDEIIHKVNNSTDLAAFGKKDVDNPLGFGAAAAYSGSQGKTVYVGRVATNDLAGYVSLITKAENIDALYAHAPMTNDLDVQLEVRAHVDGMSTEENKKWRRAYVSTPTPSDYRIIGGGNDTNVATISPNEDGNVVVSDSNGSFKASKVRNGDLFRINFSTDGTWGDAVYDNYSDGGYIVHEVIDEETLVLKSGPSKAYNVARRYEVWKKDNAENIAEFVSARSASFGSRRINNVFCDGGQYLTDDDEFVTLDPMYIAAEIAGLRTAVLPQQGLTNTEIALVSSAASMFTKYTGDQMNMIAANGSFIVTQEFEDGPRFIRHQLTTKSDSGNLYYEDSVGVNIDEISFQVKSTLRPYIGRRNVNPETVVDIFYDMFDILSERTDDPGVGNSIGPALIGFTDLVVKIDDTFKDRINVSAKLEVPLPLNVIDVTLNATASFNQGEITLESIGINRVGSTVESVLDERTTVYSEDGQPLNGQS